MFEEHGPGPCSGGVTIAVLVGTGPLGPLCRNPIFEIRQLKRCQICVNRGPERSGRMMSPSKPSAETLQKMKGRAREILEGFLPAMEKIQATNKLPEQKKRNAKEWLRAKLDFLWQETEENGKR